MTDTKYTRPVCRGDWALGTACGKCERCEETRPRYGTPEQLPVEQLDRDPIERVWSRIEIEAGAYRDDEEEQAYRVGLRDGFSEAIQLLDLLTGGNGEYSFCTVPSESHCPTPVEMGQRILARFERDLRERDRLAGEDVVERVALEAAVQQAIENLPYIYLPPVWDDDPYAADRHQTLREFFEETWQGEHADDLFKRVAEVATSAALAALSRQDEGEGRRRG